MAAFYFPPIKPVDKDKPENDRNQDLENLVGNLFITQYQNSRLISRLVDFVKSNPTKSTFMIRSDDTINPKWFQVSLDIKEIKIDNDTEPTEPVESESESTDVDNAQPTTTAATHFP